MKVRRLTLPGGLDAIEIEELVTVGHETRGRYVYLDWENREEIDRKKYSTDLFGRIEERKDDRNS